MSENESAPKNSPYFVYLLTSYTNRGTYVGVTNNLERRLRQHNGEIKGGARSTTMRWRHAGTWRYALWIGGFYTRREALQFEWRCHHETKKRRCRGLTQRLALIEEMVTKMDRWSKKHDGHPDPLHLHGPYANQIPAGPRVIHGNPSLGDRQSLEKGLK